MHYVKITLMYSAGFSGLIILLSVASDFISKQKLSSTTKKKIGYGILLTANLTAFTPIIHKLLVSWGIIETADGSLSLIRLLCGLSIIYFLLYKIREGENDQSDE